MTAETFADQLSTVVDGVDAMLVRASDRAAFREREGRHLAAGSRAQLDVLASRLDALAVEARRLATLPADHRAVAAIASRLPGWP